MPRSNSGSIRLIVGLGNPGTKYEGTRHNIGREIVERIAGEHSLKFLKKDSLQAAVARFRWQDQETILAYPSTYMNLSGQAVRALVEHFKIHAETELLTVVDEAALPFGKLRLRMCGSDGGHKGLRSIEQALQTQAFPRLRLGIASEAGRGEPLENFVLESFSTEECRALPEFLQRGREACRLWIAEDPDKVMSAVNHD